MLRPVTRKEDGRGREMERWRDGAGDESFSLSDTVVFHQALLFSLINGCQVVGGKRVSFCFHIWCNFIMEADCG